jgi:proton-coupled amino acid transporter
MSPSSPRGDFRCLAGSAPTRARGAELRVPRFQLGLFCTTMSSPSKPVNISRRAPDSTEAIAGSLGIPGSVSATPIGTPDLRALRALYAGSTPPPNIPPRTIPTPSLRPQVSDASMGQPVNEPGLPGSFRPSPALRAQTPQNGTETPLNLDLDELPDEEKARVLRRHLVSKEDRQGADATPTPPGASDLDLPPQPGGSGSRRSSSGAAGNDGGSHVEREDTDPFPIPYHTPGADVT